MDGRNDQSTIDIAETDDEENNVCIHNIRDKFSQIKFKSGESSRSEPYIRKVPRYLRDVNAEAYEPQIIAIGPYHRNKTHLRGMEKQKLRFLDILLQRTEGRGLESYMKDMRRLKEDALRCYSDPESTLDQNDEFVEMMLLDACFIVELFRKYSGTSMDKEPLFKSHSTLQKLVRDLLLAENQIPFFVLNKFFDMTQMQDDDSFFLPMISHFFADGLSLPYDDETIQDPKAIKHLLGFVHGGWVRGVVRDRSDDCCMEFNTSRPRRHSTKIPKIFNRRRCATKLREAGIKFTELKSTSLFDIKFENGIVKIPRLLIDDDIESLFQNLIVYELWYPEKSSPAIDYINFMNSLINSEKDVELLCKHQIVDNCVGDDEVVAKMFNRLGDSVTFSSRDHYREIYETLNTYCNRRWNKWMAFFRHSFKAPLVRICFLVGNLLTFLTVVQTVYTVLGYYK